METACGDSRSRSCLKQKNKSMYSKGCAVEGMRGQIIEIWKDCQASRSGPLGWLGSAGADGPGWLNRWGAGGAACQGQPKGSKYSFPSIILIDQSSKHHLIVMDTKTPAYPPGGTWFDTLNKSFVDVPVDTTNDNAIATSDFLEAAESLSTLFGMRDSSSRAAPI